MSLSGRKEKYISILEGDLRAVTAREKVAIKATRDAKETIRMYTHVANRRKITYEDLLSNNTLRHKHKELGIQARTQLEEYEEKITQATKRLNHARKELKATRHEKIILEALLSRAAPRISSTETKPVNAKTPASPATINAPLSTIRRLNISKIAPAAMFFSQSKQNPFINEIKRDLKSYIDRIESYTDETGEIDFAHGFIIFRQSQAINREANYLLARSLFRKLDQGESLDIAFNNTNEQRSKLITQYGLNKREDYVERGIGSDTLNAIIRKATKDIGTENEPLILKSMA